MRLEHFKTAVKALITFSLLNRFQILMHSATLSLCRGNTISTEFSYRGIEHSCKEIYSKMQEMLQQLGTISVKATTQNSLDAGVYKVKN